MTDRLLIVSADGHAAMPIEVLPDYLERAFHPWLEPLMAENDEILELQRITQAFSPEVLEVIDGEGALREGGRRGSFDLDVRLREMDREGIAAEVVFQGSAEATPPFFSGVNQAYPPEVRAAGGRAYTRWLAEMLHDAGGRLVGVAPTGPWADIEATVAEVRWAADHGFRAATAPGQVRDRSLPHLSHPHYEPFWRTCAELGVVVSLHAGHGAVQGRMVPFLRSLVAAAGDGQEAQHLSVTGPKGSPFAPTPVPARLLYSLMLAGVFDRHRDLRVSLTEVRADWLPATLELLDARFERERGPMRRRPSEYWAEHGWAGVSSLKRSEVRLRHRIGVDRMMFGRDYPHAEGTWPNTWDWLRDALRGVPLHEVRALLGENAVRCYGLDGPALQVVAGRIGPRPADLLDVPPVDPRIVANFASRAGYDRSFEHVDPDHLGALLDKDVAAARAAASAM